MKSLVLILATLLTSLNALGAIQTKAIEYKIGDQALEGFLAQVFSK